MISCLIDTSTLSSMALLGMSTNMRCNGYFQGYHSTRDLVFGAEGSTWTSSNGDSELKNDCYQIGSLPLPSNCHLLGYNKELLKQTILKHEAIFRDQIHELHRIYRKQRELMDEIKRNELHKHNLKLETSWSSSSLYYSQNLPQLTGQSSVLIAESFQLPLASVEGKSRKLCPASAPAAIKESLKDPKLSESTYRKVGKKILDLQLPADEYIDSEGESFENERVIKEPPLSTYTFNGISQVTFNTDEKSYAANPNGFADLNLPFKLEEAGSKSDDLGGPILHGNHKFHDTPRRMTLGFHNFPNDVIQDSSKKGGLKACSDDQLPNQGKKQGRLSLGNSTGQNGDDLGSVPKFNAMPRPGPSSASCTRAPYQPVCEADITSFGISPAVLWKNIKLGPSLDCQNYIMNNFCSRSNLLDLPSISSDDTNSHDKYGSSSVSHEHGKYATFSEDARTHKNINLNIMPTVYSDTAAVQSIQITGEDKFQASRLSWLKENPVPKGKPKDESKNSTHIESFLLNPYKSGCMHSDLKLNKVEKNDPTREKILALDLNGKPHASKACDSLSKNQWIEEIKKISDVNLPCNHDPDIGEQAPACEHFLENEKKRHKHLGGIIDLNSCMDEDENMQINIDLQAPASPENMECSPPRGESDENQLEMPLQLAGQEDPEAQEEQAKIAADALVSISGFIAQNGLQVTSLSSESVSSSLHWFAGIVSTIVDHSEGEVKVDFNGTIKDLEDILPADFDYFEFMSLNLTETKNLGCCYKSSGPSEQEGGSTSPTQPRKCRTNRGKRGKDFQSEILPSLASLSRYEVTEDLQTIGGLVEAAKTHSVTGYLRSAGRNVLARGKRKSCASASNITDLLLNLKHQNSNSEIAIEKRGLISWGKICRKRRGQRFPTSKPHFIFSPVHN